MNRFWDFKLCGASPLLSSSLWIDHMPAYTTISFEFDKRARNRLVSEFYAAFLGDGVTFDRVFPWGCEPDLSYQQIVDWNQDKLIADFRLGYTRDVSHDFRQMLITVHPFSECRLFLMNMDTSIEFHCIIPENEINTENAGSARRLPAGLPTDPYWPN